MSSPAPDKLMDESLVLIPSAIKPCRHNKDSLGYRTVRALLFSPFNGHCLQQNQNCTAIIILQLRCVQIKNRLLWLMLSLQSGWIACNVRLFVRFSLGWSFVSFVVVFLVSCWALVKHYYTDWFQKCQHWGYSVLVHCLAAALIISFAVRLTEKNIFSLHWHY